MYGTAMRPTYDCVNPVCRAWRWVDAAKRNGEVGCAKCGTAFMAEAIRLWPPLPEGGKGKGKGKGGGGRGQGGAAAGGAAGAPHQVQGGKGSEGTGEPGRHPKRVGAQGHYPLQGCGGKGGGAGKPTGAATPPQRSGDSPVARAEARLAKLLDAYDGDHTHDHVKAQRRIVEDLQKEEEARRPPHQKAIALRKELEGAYDSMGRRFAEIEGFADKIAELQEALAVAEDYAEQEYNHILTLRKDIGELESQCNLAQVKKAGPTVDTSYEAQLQKATETMVSIYIAGHTSRRGKPPAESEIERYRQQCMEVYAKGCEGILPEVPDEDMEDAASVGKRTAEDQEQPDAKAARLAKARAARADAIARGDDVDMDEEVYEEPGVVEGWTQVGTNPTALRIRVITYSVAMTHNSYRASRSTAPPPGRPGRRRLRPRRWHYVQGSGPRRPQRLRGPLGSVHVPGTRGTPVRCGRRTSTFRPSLGRRAQDHSRVERPRVAAPQDLLQGLHRPRESLDRTLPLVVRRPPRAQDLLQGRHPRGPPQWQARSRRPQQGGGWSRRMNTRRSRMPWALMAHPPRHPIGRISAVRTQAPNWPSSP